MSAAHQGRASPHRRVRPDGSVEYRCPKCGRLLVVGQFGLQQGNWVQAFCRTCKRERRFDATDDM